MDLKKTIRSAAVLLALVSLAHAAKYTTTLTYFNIASVEAFTVTLPGQTAVGATTGGAATANIEFNSTTGTDTCVDPCIAASTTCQSAGTPIFLIENTGTVNLHITVNFTQSPPSCIKVAGSSASRAAACTGTIIDTSAVTVSASLQPSQQVSWWEAANFTSCVSSDSTTRTQWVYGVQS